MYAIGYANGISKFHVTHGSLLGGLNDDATSSRGFTFPTIGIGYEVLTAMLDLGWPNN